MADLGSRVDFVGLGAMGEPMAARVAGLDFDALCLKILEQTL